MSAPVTFIIGCTGSGKGSIGRELALRCGGEIVSIDSMKVYRRMDIGTAKPSAAERARISHHLIDVAEPSDEFSVAQYVPLAEAAIGEIQGRGRPVFVVGGTPLYVKALTEGMFEGPGADAGLRARLSAVAKEQGKEELYRRLREVDPRAAVRIHPNDLRRTVRALEVYELTGRPISELQQQWDQSRMRFSCVLLGVRRGLEDQNRRTNERVRYMISDGLVDEVRGLLSEVKPLGTAARQALGYAEVIRHLQRELTLAQAVELIKINTRRFAKAQRTWFKRFSITEWVDLLPESDPGAVASALMERYGSSWSPSPK